MRSGRLSSNGDVSTTALLVEDLVLAMGFGEIPAIFLGVPLLCYICFYCLSLLCLIRVSLLGSLSGLSLFVELENPALIDYNN